MSLPDKFPDTAVFFDVEGVPVVVLDPSDMAASAFAFDPDKRRFPSSSAWYNGAAISEAEFRDMVAKAG